jgi:hypothetical protein
MGVESPTVVPPPLRHSYHAPVSSQNFPINGLYTPESWVVKSLTVPQSPLAPDTYAATPPPTPCGTAQVASQNLPFDASYSPVPQEPRQRFPFQPQHHFVTKQLFWTTNMCYCSMCDRLAK